MTSKNTVDIIIKRSRLIGSEKQTLRRIIHWHEVEP